MKTIQILGADSLLFRDGRPFDENSVSNKARTLPLPYPSTVAGFLRTQIGLQRGADWGNQALLSDLRNVTVHAPLLHHAEKGILLPAPADAVRLKDADDKIEWMKLEPASERTGGTDMPDGLAPLLVTKEGKPVGKPFWSLNTMNTWLQGDPLPLDYEEFVGPQTEERVHVQINPKTGTSQEGMLFSVEYLDLGMEWSLLARVEAEDTLRGIGTFGGERRMAITEETTKIKWPKPKSTLLETLKSATQVRLILATPAAFAKGWKPGWIGDDRIGTPPGITPDQLELKLVSAAVPRKQAVSGWDYEKRSAKPVRWLAPAGSVYFFEVRRANPDVWEKLWLQSVCDDDQDKRDGYGLALWGVYGGQTR